MAAVAAIARERGCRRLSWSVLDWNRPALDFYERLGAREDRGDWLAYSLSGEALSALADRMEGA
jgi:RimJ/RimL family protein N-acetyltransferase